MWLCQACFKREVLVERRMALSEKWATLISKTPTCVAVSKQSNNEESRRRFTHVFYVSNGAVSERVCKTAFLLIFLISNGRLSRVIQAQAAPEGLPHCDQRGKHTPANRRRE